VAALKIFELGKISLAVQWLDQSQRVSVSLSLDKNDSDPERFTRSFSDSDRLIVDFLMEEVTSRHPREVVDFLTISSMFDRFCAPLCDFLPKPFETKDLLSAIVKALERDAHDVQEESQKKKINALMDSLTPREKEVLRWIIAGKLNKQIAHALGTTERTIKAHRSRIKEKLCVDSVAELVRLAEKVDIKPTKE